MIPETCPTCGGRIKVVSIEPPYDSKLEDLLQPRELEVCFWKAHGLTNKETAFKMKISEQTIKNHVSHILRKTECLNMVHLVAKYKVHLG